MSDNGQQNLGDALGLGRHFTPGPVTWSFVDGRLGDGKAVICRLEHASGTTAVVLPAESARRFAEQLLERTTGLAIADRLPNEDP